MPSIDRRTFLRRVAAGTAVGAASVLAACSTPFTPAPSPTPMPQTIVLWSWIDQAANTLVRDFSAKYPQITVKVESVGYERGHQQLARALKEGGQLPDIAMIDLPFVGAMRDTGGLVDLAGPPFDGAALKNDMLPQLWDAGSYQGRQVVMPWNLGIGLGWYRPDIFQAAGLPSAPEQVSEATRTWDEWLALDRALRKANPKISLLGAADALFAPRLLQQGYGWVDGTHLLVEERGMPAAELVVRGIEQGLPPTMPGSQFRSKLVDGSLVGIVNPSWIQFLLQQSLGQPGTWRIIHPPGGDYLSGAIFFAIPQQSQAKEAAWSFVRYYAADTVGQNSTFFATGAFPAYRPAWNDPTYTRPVEFFGGQAAYQIMAEAAQNLPPVTISPYDYQIDTRVYQQLDPITNKRKTPEQAMAEAEQALLKELPGLTR